MRSKTFKFQSQALIYSFIKSQRLKVIFLNNQYREYCRGNRSINIRRLRSKGIIETLSIFTWKKLRQCWHFSRQNEGDFIWLISTIFAYKTKSVQSNLLKKYKLFLQNLFFHILIKLSKVLIEIIQ